MCYILYKVLSSGTSHADVFFYIFFVFTQQKIYIYTFHLSQFVVVNCQNDIILKLIKTIFKYLTKSICKKHSSRYKLKKKIFFGSKTHLQLLIQHPYCRSSISVVQNKSIWLIFVTFLITIFVVTFKFLAIIVFLIFECSYLIQYSKLFGLIVELLLYHIKICIFCPWYPTCGGHVYLFFFWFYSPLKI